MSKSKYRNLHVDGVAYKYVIGESYVKIVRPTGNELVKKAVVSVKSHYDELITTPGMIAAYIQGQEIKASDFFESCEHKGGTLRVNPFINEVEQKKIYLILCEDCNTSLAEDI